MLLKNKALKYIILILVSFFCAISLESKVKTGIDVLIENGFNEIKGKNIALLTNITGKTGDGSLTAELLSKSESFILRAIFTPEHGFYAKTYAGLKVNDSTVFGVVAFSLYGTNRKPAKEQLSNCDVVVIDLQDIGIRSYTYFSTVFNMMGVCARMNIPVIILDRPNPIDGITVDGNVLEQKFRSFIGIVPVTYIHGCTIGELAYMANEEGWLDTLPGGKPAKCNLKVIKMQGWERWMRWEDTGLDWTATSPNIPTPDAVRGAAMLGIFGELGIVGIGIGTDKPFQYFGRPGLNSYRVLQHIDNEMFPGISFDKNLIQPEIGKHKDKKYSAISLTFYHSPGFKPYTSGIMLMLAARVVNHNIFPKKGISNEQRSMFCKATGTDLIYNAFLKRATDGYILKLATKGIEDFMHLRVKYLLY